MNCKNHKNQIAIEKCTSCGQWFCDDCIEIRDDQPFCNSCLGIKTPHLNTNYSKEIITPVTKKDYTHSDSFDPVIIEENGKTIILNTKEDIENHNSREKLKIMNKDNEKHLPATTKNFKFKIIAGIILLMIHNPITLFIGVILIATALIDRHSAQRRRF